MNTDEAALYRVIESNPHEVTPRLALADLLTELGRDAEAELWKLPPHRNSPFESLIGRTVRVVKFNGSDTLTFYTDGGPISYEGEGDCCSESWLYRILGADKLIGQRIVAVAVDDDDDVDANDGLGRQEYDSVDGYRVLTGTGACRITWRNSSNGYYGNCVRVSQEDRCGTEDSFEVVTSWQHPPPMNCTTGDTRSGCRCTTCMIPGGES
jgi:uncharacterized protein (TIGR02996 family)